MAAAGGDSAASLLPAGWVGYALLPLRAEAPILEEGSRPDLAGAAELPPPGVDAARRWPGAARLLTVALLAAAAAAVAVAFAAAAHHGPFALTPQITRQGLASPAESVQLGDDHLKDEEADELARHNGKHEEGGHEKQVLGIVKQALKQMEPRIEQRIVRQMELQREQLLHNITDEISRALRLRGDAAGAAVVRQVGSKFLRSGGHVRDEALDETSPATTSNATSRATANASRTTSDTAAVSAASTSATTTSLASTSVTSTTAMPQPPTLFCFVVMVSVGHELELMRTQLAKGAGIFACDDWDVYSNVSVWLSPGPPVKLMSSVITADLATRSGARSHILNTPIFMKAWEKVFHDRRFHKHGWTVKVDPDTVFFPARLVAHLSRAVATEVADPSAYFTNCLEALTHNLDLSFFGAIEVVSRGAVKTYNAGRSRCMKELSYREMGEDLFMQKCLDLLQVHQLHDPGLLSDGYCTPQPLTCESDRVAFHPYKSVANWEKCLAEATK